MTKKHEDISGRIIKVGDYVIYAALWSRSATLKYGRVLYLTWGSNGLESNVCKIQIVSVDRSWDDSWELQGSGYYGFGPKPDIKDTKVQTLGFLDRTLVVTKTQIPESARKFLDAAYAARSK